MLKSEPQYFDNLNMMSHAGGSKRDLEHHPLGPNHTQPPKRLKSASSSKKENQEVMIKGAWSPEEDQEMLKGVAKYGTDWKSIAKCVRGRTAKQCRDRYKLKLDPSINHGPWTPEEDQTLLNLHAQLGRQWTKIAKLMKGRTENSVKSRYASLERSRTREWTEEEDRILRANKERDVPFEDIAKFHLPHRSEHAVKKRWERLFMRDLARKIRSEMPSLKNNTQQQYKQKSPFPINPRLLPSANEQKANSDLPVAPGSAPISAPVTVEPQSEPRINFAAPVEIYPSVDASTLQQNAPADSYIESSAKLEQQAAPPMPRKKSSRQSKFKRHSTSVTVMMQLIGEPLNK